MVQSEFPIEGSADAFVRHATSARTVLRGEFLFREGDVKSSVYRVEGGAICTYELPRLGREPFLDFVYSGDWLGFGYLDKHTCLARALVASCVSCFPLSSVDALIELSPRARTRMADSIEREFGYVHDAILGGRPPSPSERVAALLIGLASIGRREGRDPNIVVESISSGLVAESLTMSVNTLAAVLVEFGERGFIEPWKPGGVRLKDMAALEAIASQRVRWNAPERPCWTPEERNDARQL